MWPSSNIRRTCLVSKRTSFLSLLLCESTFGCFEISSPKNKSSGKLGFISWAHFEFWDLRRCDSLVTIIVKGTSHPIEDHKKNRFAGPTKAMLIEVNTTKTLQKKTDCREIGTVNLQYHCEACWNRAARISRPFL